MKDYYDDLNGINDPFDDPLILDLQVSGQNRWAIAWSDLMMTMFILFAVMYIYQAGHREFDLTPGDTQSQIVEQDNNQGQSNEAEKMPSQVFDHTLSALDDEFVSSFTNVDFVKNKAIKISIASDLMFDIGKAEIKVRAMHRLRQIADILNQNNLAINVAGHTDITPINSALYPTNWECALAKLSQIIFHSR